MTNTNIQGVIPIAGKGLTYRTDGKYQPGEYSVFTNVEIIDDAIKTRRPVAASVDGQGGATYDPVKVLATGFLPNFMGFAGYFKDNLIAAGANEVWQCYKGNSKMWNAAALPAPPGGFPASPVNTHRGHFPLAVFNYGLDTFWVTHKYEYNVVNEIYVYKRTSDAKTIETDTTLPAGPTLVLTRPVVPGNGLMGDRPFIKFFIHKERLFLVFTDRIYFSKATDPTKFTVFDDGGFIGIERGLINDVVSVGDTIYIATDYATYIYTYSNSPNSDGYMRSIYKGPPVTSLVIKDDIVYGATKLALYQIYNTSFEKVVDFTTVFANTHKRENTVVKMVAFGDSIVMLRHYMDGGRRQVLNGPVTDIHFFNLNNGSMSKFEFSDRHNTTGFGTRVSDVDVNPYDNTLYLAVTGMWPADANNSRTRIYFMNESRSINADATIANRSTINSSAAMDYAFFDDDTVNRIRVNFEVRADNWTPDGSEFLLKKFRSLNLEGRLPNLNDANTYIRIYYDNYPVQTFATKQMTDVPMQGKNREFPYTYVIRLNQKSKTLGFRINSYRPLDNEQFNALEEDYSYLAFTLSRLVAYWQFTENRGTQIARPVNAL